MFRRTVCVAAKPSKEVRAALKLLRSDASVTRKALKESYRELAKIYHPDLNAGEEGRMKELNKAFSVAETFLEVGGGGGGGKTPEKSSRVGENREDKKKEVSLVGKLAEWMREDSKNNVDNPVFEEFRKFTAKDEEQKMKEVLGTEADELKWAEEYRRHHILTLQQKNLWRENSKRTKIEHNPYDIDRYSERVTKERLENLSQKDPKLYWAKPLEVPCAPAEFLPERQNPHIEIARKKRAERFFNHKAWKLVEREKHEANVERAKRRDRYFNFLLKGEPVGLANLEKKVQMLHETSLAPHNLPKEPAPVSSLGTRAPRTLRKSQSLVSFPSKDHQGKPVTVTMNKARFLTRGNS